MADPSPPTPLEEPDLAYGVARYYPPADVEEARLVTSPSTPVILTPRRRTSVRQAASRALAQYLSHCAIATAGREVRFKRVLDQWADTETDALFPSASVLADSDIEYGAVGEESLSPAESAQPIPGTALFWSTVAQVRVDLSIDVWCTSEADREAAVRLVEDALSPVDWMYGFRLIAPFYHSAAIVYEPKRVRYQDAETDDARRYRRATWSVRAELQQIRVRGKLPLMRPQPRLTVE